MSSDMARERERRQWEEQEHRQLQVERDTEERRRQHKEVGWGVVGCGGALGACGPCGRTLGESVCGVSMWGGEGVGGCCWWYWC